MRAEGVDREERIPVEDEFLRRQRIQVHFGATQALIALEALLLLPEHHEQVPALQDVAATVLERLPILRIFRVPHHAGLPLLQPLLAVAFPQIRLHVGV